MCSLRKNTIPSRENRLPAQAERRTDRAARLRQGLQSIDGLAATPATLDARVTTHAYHLFSMRYDPARWSGVTRDTFVAALQAEGVPASAGYPYPIYRNALFTDRPHRALPCPHAEAYCQTAVWLPHNALLAEEGWIDQVLEAIRKVRGAIAELVTQAT